MEAWCKVNKHVCVCVCGGGGGVKRKKKHWEYSEMRFYLAMLDKKQLQYEV